MTLWKQGASAVPVLARLSDHSWKRYAHDAHDDHGRADATGSKLGNERCPDRQHAADADAGGFQNDPKPVRPFPFFATQAPSQRFRWGFPPLVIRRSPEPQGSPGSAPPQISMKILHRN